MGTRTSTPTSVDIGDPEDTHWTVAGPHTCPTETENSAPRAPIPFPDPDSTLAFVRIALLVPSLPPETAVPLHLGDRVRATLEPTCRFDDSAWPVPTPEFPTV